MMAALALAACGPAYPAGWGEGCWSGGPPCLAGMVCLGRRELPCEGERCPGARCELPGPACPSGWSLASGYCRLPCGEAWGPCPAGTACVGEAGCAPL